MLFALLSISTYSIDKGGIQKAMVQYDLTAGVYFNFEYFRKPLFSNFELGKMYMHPCLLVRLVYRQAGGVFI